MIHTKPLTPEDAQTLAELNAAVDKAIEDRTKWLDSKMAEYCEVAIGEEVFTREGSSLGFVTRHYRFHAGRDGGIYDKVLSVDVEFSIPDSRIFNNSSCDPFAVYSKKGLVERTKRLLSQIEGG